MKLLTEDAVVICNHILGTVQIAAMQDLVTIDGRRVLVSIDPEGRPIKSCPNIGATIKPCLRTLKVDKGYSDLLRIDGRQAVLDILDGLTDGTPPGTVHYVVRDPGQELVDEGG